MSVTLHVKHASKVYDVVIDLSSDGVVLKQKLEALTGVPAAKQKVMVKGQQIQDAVSLETLKLKDGQQLFMLGTAAAAEAPRPASSSDNAAMTVDSDGEADDEYKQPVGLVNVGNTCYANATLEALHTVPELNEALREYKGSDDLIKSWSQLIPQFGYEFDEDHGAPIPAVFLIQLRKRFPQFAEIGEEGAPKQQDAEEFWTQLLWELREVDEPLMKSVVSSFDGTFRVHTNKSSGPEVSEEQFTKLMCHINIGTNFLKDGLRQSLVDEIETGENESHKSRKQISRLPKYLTVQFVRFFWRRDTQKNSKILRKVTFPMNLDIGDLCTEELQARMAPARESYRELESAVEENKRSARRARFKKLDAMPIDPTGHDADTETLGKRKAAADAEDREEAKDLERLEDLRKQFKKNIDAGLAADPTCSPHALYELQAIVTHQGMSADSGHYQCFTKNTTKTNSWWRFNDDRVTEVDDSRIAQLAGGGASDSALILLYKSCDH